MGRALPAGESDFDVLHVMSYMRQRVRSATHRGIASLCDVACACAFACADFGGLDAGRRQQTYPGLHPSPAV